jgi:hypothetical protein
MIGIDFLASFLQSVGLADSPTDDIVPEKIEVIFFLIASPSPYSS